MEKKYTVITGASSGIGRAAASAFAARGKALVLTARRADRLEDLRWALTARHPGLPVLVRPADLSDPENARRFYESLGDLPLETWVNNAGFGWYEAAGRQDPARLTAMLTLDAVSPVLLSSLFVRDYRDAAGAQLLNVAPCGGYVLVPRAAAYCAAKFCLAAFTEALDRELREAGAALRAKVLAPAATETEFGRVANDAPDYDYARRFPARHTAAQAADFLLRLYDSDRTVGLVDRETMTFSLSAPRFPYAGHSAANQREA